MDLAPYFYSIYIFSVRGCNSNDLLLITCVSDISPSIFNLTILHIFCRYRVLEEENDVVPSEISSKKLTDLGFTYKHGIEDIFHQTVSCCLGYGFLPPI